MARPERFELPTAWFVARYSIQLSYGRVVGDALSRNTPSSVKKLKRFARLKLYASRAFWLVAYPCQSQKRVAIFRETRNGSVRFRERKIGDKYAFGGPKRPASAATRTARSPQLPQ